MASTSDVVALCVTTVVGSLPLAVAGGIALWEGTPGVRMSALYAVLYFTISQVLGVLAVTPAMLAFASRAREPRRWLTARRIETILLAVAVLIAGTYVMVGDGRSGTQLRFFLLAVTPLYMWAALRGSPTVALLLPGITMLVASYGDAHSIGLFERAHFPYDARGIQAIGGMLTLFTALLVANETSHRRALREVIEREAKLKRVLSGSNDGFWEWDVRGGGLDVSDRVAGILGIPHADCPRQLKDYLRFVHPEDAALAVRSVKLHRLAGAAHMSTEYRVRHSAGHWVWVQSRGHVAERDASGNPLRISGTISDITEHKQAELALRASQQLFTSFMRYSPAAAFIRDAEGRLIYVNRAYEEAIWGDDVPEWSGRKMTDLFRPDVANIYLESDQRVLAEQRSLVVEQRIPARRGTLIWLTVKFPLHDHAGQLHVGAMALDITDRRRAEEQRRVLEARTTEAQKLESLGLLAGGVAHDFNNILTSVLGYADLARTTLEAGSPLRENLSRS
jgi:PAS domain S-box-containing protein